MTRAHEVNHEVADLGRQLRAAIPDVYAGYAQMSSAALGEGGELSPSIREVIALAIAVTKECDGCIAAHARGAARRGASAQEVAEALGTCTYTSSSCAPSVAPNVGARLAMVARR